MKKPKKGGGAQQRGQQLKKERQEKFIQAYLREGTIYHACIAVGINRTTHYDWLKDDPGYRKLFDEAYQCYTEILVAGGLSHLI
jgi:hypothetical protein